MSPYVHLNDYRIAPGGTYAEELVREREEARQRFKAYRETDGDIAVLIRWGIRAVLDCRGSVREVR